MSFARFLTRTGRSVSKNGRSFSTEQVKKTKLYDAHVEAGGKIVPFAGYALPVQYKDSIINSHLHCRSAASVFDVSHMGQVRIHGKERARFLESLTVCDVAGLKPNQARLSVLTTPLGGTIDDCMITSKADHIFMVVNAGCKDKDLAHMRQQLSVFNSISSSKVTLEYIEDRSLIALQGPKAAEVLSRHVQADISKLGFMFTAEMKVGGIDCWVSRCGYTGEDGFEISVHDSQAVALWNTFLKQQEVLAAGLGVRDSLRLEAGLCLYGHELDETVSPVEAGLAWTIGKRRREEGGFLGADVILKQLKEGVTRKRVGLTIAGAPAREQTEIYSEKGDKIGIVTSGTFSPSLKKPVSMGYVSTPFAAAGTKVTALVRGKHVPAEVTKLPFVPTNYYKGA